MPTDWVGLSRRDLRLHRLPKVLPQNKLAIARSGSSFRDSPTDAATADPGGGLSPLDRHNSVRACRSASRSAPPWSKGRMQGGRTSDKITLVVGSRMESNDDVNRNRSRKLGAAQMRANAAGVVPQGEKHIGVPLAVVS